jgi:hypothetical protein
METNRNDKMDASHGNAGKSGVDFDRSEPRALLIASIGIASILGLTAMILGVQAYFDHMHEQQMYEKVLVPVSQDLKNLHSQEDQELNTYKYIDRDKGIVQIPITRAMQLIEQEAAAGKIEYFHQPTPVKVPNAAGAAPASAPAAGANPAAPAGANPTAPATAAPQPNGSAAPPKAATVQKKLSNGSAGSSSSGTKT